MGVIVWGDRTLTAKLTAKKLHILETPNLSVYLYIDLYIEIFNSKFLYLQCKKRDLKTELECLAQCK